MKNIFTFLFLACVTGLVSCGSGGNKINNLLAVPAGDTTSLGSTFLITFNNTGVDSEEFSLRDLAVNNSPIYTMTAVNVENPADSFWTGQLVVTDFTKSQFSLNLIVYRDSLLPVGNYWVQTNGSTLTDFSKGQNISYSIAAGSYVNYNAVGTTFTYGTFYLNILYNYKLSTAYGSFQIYK